MAACTASASASCSNKSCFSSSSAFSIRLNSPFTSPCCVFRSSMASIRSSSLKSRQKLRTGRAVRKLSTTERFPATLLLRGAHECLGSHHEARGLPPRAFLPAASREPVDRGSGGAGLGRPLPRLERADRRGVLRPERRGPAQERQRPHLRHRQQLRPPLLQLRPDAPRLARAT